VITRESFFFGAALALIVIAGFFIWAIFLAPPAGCRQTGPHEYLCDRPMSAPNSAALLQR
jgi:hypothetical protein